MANCADGEMRRAIIAAALSNTAPALVRKLHTKLAETLGRNGFARLLHQIEVVIEIVNCVQPCSENFIDPLQVV